MRERRQTYLMRRGRSEEPPDFNPQGNLARLADVPLRERLLAFEILLDSGELSEDEIPVAFAAAIDPGELSTRLAA